MRCSAALRPPREFRRGTTLARTCWTSWRISDGVGSSMRRLPHWSVTRFQYEPYARRQPSLTRADTTGMYSAKVGAAAWPPGRPAGRRGSGPSAPAGACAASTTACPGAAERASGPVIVIGLLLHVPGTGWARRGPGPPPRASTRSACPRRGPGCQQDRVSGEQPAAVPQRRGDRDVGRGGRVARPSGSRRAVTTPALAVRVSRSPPRQPSARVTVRSATRPEASMRPRPYTTSAARAGACPGEAAGGAGSGQRRAAARRAGPRQDGG